MSEPLAQIARSPVVRTGARLGYVVSGVIHVAIGLLALRLAAGDRTAQPDQSGALAALAGTPFGVALLALTVAGLALLAVSQAVRAVRDRGTGDRVKAGAKAVAYLALAAGATGFLVGRPGSSGQQAQDATSWLLSLPAGLALVVAVGLGVAGIGIYHGIKGGRRRFRRDLTEEPPRPIIVLGVLGYVAKGVALVTVGVLFVQAALTHDPGRSRGLDGALAALLQLPFGPVVVGTVGAGFAAYGVYSFARARFARL